MKMLEDSLIRTAYRRYADANEQRGYITDQPSNDSDVVTHDNTTYVVLRNVRGTLAVYAVEGQRLYYRPEGSYPPALDQY